MKIRVLLIKEVESIEEGQTLYDQLKEVIASVENIEKFATIKDDTELA